MRVTTAFNKLLSIPDGWVTSVAFTPGGVVVGIRRRQRRPSCPCGWKGRAVYDRSVRRWRHLDLGASKLFLEGEIRRIECAACDRVRTEAVPWARPAARHTRDFEDVVGWLCQHTDKTTVTKLMRTSWETVAGIVNRVVADHVDGRRLEDLYRIGVDEVSYRKGHRYLTIVADHDRDGVVVWAGEGRGAAALEAFYNELGTTGCAQLEAVSLDMSGAYKKATDLKAPDARQCVDPFHVIKLANTAIDTARRQAWNQTRPRGPVAKRAVGRPKKGTPPLRDPRSRWVKNTRWALVKDPDDLKPSQLEILHQLRRSGSVLYRCWQLKEGLRDLYRLANPDDAAAHLDWWLAWACRSRIPSFVSFSKTVRANRDRIIASVELGLSNGKLEGINSKIRLINHRGYGHHTATAVIAMVYLCCGGITLELPTQR